MGEMSIWHWAAVAILFFITVFPVWRILRKAGFSGWWSIFSIIPMLNILMIWIFAFVRWPSERTR